MHIFCEEKGQGWAHTEHLSSHPWGTCSRQRSYHHHPTHFPFPGMSLQFLSIFCQCFVALFYSDRLEGTGAAER